MPSADRNMAWAKHVRENRKARQMTRRALAFKADIDPSYLTLIERDGYVPRKNHIKRIGLIFGDVGAALLVCGHVPEEHAGRVRAFLRGALPDHVPEDIAPTIRELADAPAHLRKQATAVIAALLKQKEPIVRSRRRQAADQNT